MSSEFGKMVGRAAEFATVLRAAEVVAACDVSVLILGETGTGKERLAEQIHRAGNRARAPFVAVNCAALPAELADAELFGHRKGAFTGALEARPGRIAEADGGTLFLDEIGELSPAVQAKLLRFLENGECQVVGGGSRRVDARIVAATNRDLQQEVKVGRFREDLFYRLHVVPLELPPLRERRGDVALLLDHFIGQLAERHGLPAPRLDAAALKRLEEYPWPGNVRELRNLCERLVILLSGREIGIDNLPAEFRARGVDRVAGVLLPEGGLNLETVEIQLIRQALERTGGNRTHAARLLGISRDTLLYRIKKHALAV